MVMLTKSDIDEACLKVVEALGRNESTEIMMALNDFQSLMLSVGSIKRNALYILLGDAAATLSYHLREMYSRFVPGVAPKEILQSAISCVKSTIGKVQKNLNVIRKEMGKEEPDYRVIMESLGEIYLNSYDLYKFGSAYVLPSEVPSEM